MNNFCTHFSQNQENSLSGKQSLKNIKGYGLL